MLIVNYGATATERATWSIPTDDGSTQALTPYPGVITGVVDDEDRPLPPGHEGIVRIGGPQVAQAYLEPEPLSRNRAFEFPRAGQAGDRGVLDANGGLRLVGRAADRINIGGVKLNPEALEAALGGVRECAFFAFADGRDREYSCVAVVPGPGYDAAAIKARFRQELGSLSPQFVLELRMLPRTENGKVVKRERALAARRASDRTE